MFSKKLIFISFLILFTIPIIAYSFFPSSNFNIWLSTRPILAQIYAFPLATATTASLLSFLYFSLSFYKKNKQICFYSGILLLLSFILLLFGTDKTLSSASNKTKTLKLVTWNVANQIEEQHIERIFSHFDADIAIFPELATNIRENREDREDQENQQIQLLFQQVGLSISNYDIFTSPPTDSGIAPVTVIIKKSYGFYTKAETFHTTRFGTIVLHSRKQNLPDIIALHTAPPLPGLMEVWKQDLHIIHNQLASKYPKAIIAGDFNDYSTDKSIKILMSNGFVHVSDDAKGANGAEGTYKYQGKWGSIDHVFLSRSLLPNFRECFIADSEFLLCKDEDYGGIQPRRNLKGVKWQNGFSDHLPLVVRFYF